MIFHDVKPCFKLVNLGKYDWDKLFEPPNFFGKYRHFIVLEASSACEEDQLQWEGLVESKVGAVVVGPAPVGGAGGEQGRGSSSRTSSSGRGWWRVR